MNGRQRSEERKWETSSPADHSFYLTTMRMERRRFLLATAEKQPFGSRYIAIVKPYRNIDDQSNIYGYRSTLYT